MNEDPIQHNFEKIIKIIYSDKNDTKLNISTSLGSFYTRAPKPMIIKTKYNMDNVSWSNELATKPPPPLSNRCA